MDELLKKLLAADILNEDTKVELESAFQSQLSEAVEAAEADASARVRAELTEQWVTERTALIEAVDAKVDDFLGRELAELKESIESFRDLEAEFAEKLVESKETMSKELETDMSALVEKLNTFLEIRLTQELDELKEDLNEAKKLQFGKEVFEGIAKEFSKNFIEEGSAEAELAEAKIQLESIQAELVEAKQANDKVARSTKLNSLLEPLSGKNRDVMEAILRNVPTEGLEEGYATFIGRVLKESTEESTDVKEGEVLAESGSEDKPEEIKGVTVSGDVEDVILEQKDAEEVAEVIVESEQTKHLRKLAGI